MPFQRHEVMLDYDRDSALPYLPLLVRHRDIDPITYADAGSPLPTATVH